MRRKEPGWLRSLNQVAKAALRLFGPSVLSPKPGMVSMLNGAWSPEDFLGVWSVQASLGSGVGRQDVARLSPARACKRSYVPCTKRDDVLRMHTVWDLFPPPSRKDRLVCRSSRLNKGIHRASVSSAKKKRDERICPSHVAMPVLVSQVRKNQLQLCASK